MPSRAAVTDDGQRAVPSLVAVYETVFDSVLQKARSRILEVIEIKDAQEEYAYRKRRRKDNGDERFSEYGGPDGQPLSLHAFKLFVGVERAISSYGNVVDADALLCSRIPVIAVGYARYVCPELYAVVSERKLVVEYEKAVRAPTVIFELVLIGGNRRAFGVVLRYPESKAVERLVAVVAHSEKEIFLPAFRQHDIAVDGDCADVLGVCIFSLVQHVVFVHKFIPCAPCPQP